MTRKTAKWFALGFSLTVMLLLAIMNVGPMFVSAQEGGNSNAEAYQGGQAPASSRTDDLLGRSSIPLLGEAAASDAGTNNAAMAVAAPSALRSDDPRGRNEVPLADFKVSGSNETATESLESSSGGIVSAEVEAERHSSIQGPTLAGPSSPLVIPGADFRSDGLFPENIFFSFAGGYLRGDSVNINDCVMAPAYLPNGVTVSDIYASVYDNDVNYRIFVNLYRVDNYAGSVDLMASMATTPPGALDAIQVISDYPVDFPLVSYPSFSYYVGSCVESSAIRLYSVRIYYH